MQDSLSLVMFVRLVGHDTQALQIVLSGVVNVDALTEDGMSPLYAAVYGLWPVGVAALLAAGADIRRGCPLAEALVTGMSDDKTCLAWRAAGRVKALVERALTAENEETLPVAHAA